MSTDIPIMSFVRLRILTYTQIAASALLVYDYFLTFSSEVTLIWPSQFTFVKVLFFLTRYLPFIDVFIVVYFQTKVNISAEECKQWYVPSGWLLVIGVVIAEIILVFRTWAIWGRGWRLGVILAVALTAAVVPCLVIEGIFLNSLEFAPHPGRATTGCLLSAGNVIVAADFVIVILFETFVLVLTLIKGIQHYRVGGRHSLISVLYRDGILFYLYLLGVSATNFIVTVSAPRDIASILAVLQRVLHSCLSARVLLNLREASRREFQPSLSSLPLRNLVGTTGTNNATQFEARILQHQPTNMPTIPDMSEDDLYDTLPRTQPFVDQHC